MEDSGIDSDNKLPSPTNKSLLSENSKGSTIDLKSEIGEFHR